MEDDSLRTIGEKLPPNLIRRVASQLTSGGVKNSTSNTNNFRDTLKDAADLNEYHRGSGREAVPTQPPDVYLTPDAKTILEALANENGMTVTQEALADVTHLSIPTIRKNLHFLRSNGLTHRPHGERKGDAITDAGHALLARR